MGRKLPITHKEGAPDNIFKRRSWIENYPGWKHTQGVLKNVMYRYSVCQTQIPWGFFCFCFCFLFWLFVCVCVFLFVCCLFVWFFFFLVCCCFFVCLFVCLGGGGFREGVGIFVCLFLFSFVFVGSQGQSDRWKSLENHTRLSPFYFHFY